MYCNDNPANTTDKTGLIAPIIIVIAAAAAAGGVANVAGQFLCDVISGAYKSSKKILDDAMTYGLMAGSIGKIGKSLGLDKLIKIPGISKGRNSYTAIYDKSSEL